MLEFYENLHWYFQVGVVVGLAYVILAILYFFLYQRGDWPVVFACILFLGTVYVGAWPLLWVFAAIRTIANTMMEADK